MDPITNDIATAARLRDILQRTIREIADLPEFENVWPVYGWDRLSTIETLRDMTPPNRIACELRFVQWQRGLTVPVLQEVE